MTQAPSLYAFRCAPVSGQSGVGKGMKEQDARLMALDDGQLDSWNERVAICMVDGGLSQGEAEAIAWREGRCRHVIAVGIGTMVARRKTL
jgi:hypothetical protein